MCHCGELETTNPGANRLAAMDFRFLPTVGMTGKVGGMTGRGLEAAFGENYEALGGRG